MKRIRVPEGMLKAAMGANYAGEGPLIKILEAALLWLSENPQVPTDEQLRQIFETQNYGVSRLAWKEYFAEWQRRCFVQEEEPEIPEEIKDLLCANATMDRKERNETILEAYRRGLRKRGE